jgi:hypothetical protein
MSKDEDRKAFEAWLSAYAGDVETPPRDVWEAFCAGVQHGRKTAPLPVSIQEALNSGDGVYRP